MTATDTQPDTRIAVPCTCCGQWLVADTSVARGMGPVCAGRHRPRRDQPGLFELPAGEVG